MLNFMEDFLTYQVKNGDTLSSVSILFNIPAEEIKTFHNQHCLNTEKLWFDNLLGIKTLIIPANYKSPAEAAEEKNRSRPYKIFSPFFLFNSYHVEETIEKIDEPVQLFSYEADFIFKNNENGRHIISWHRKNMNFNREKPDSKMDSLAIESMDILFPISFLLTENGQIQEIKQHAELLKKFEKERRNLEDFYVGEVTRIYLDKMRKVVQNKELLLSRLCSTLFIQVMFPDLIWFWKEDSWKMKWILLPNSFPINFHFSPQQDHSDSENIFTTFSGKTDDFVSLRDLLMGRRTENIEKTESIDAEIELRYETSKLQKQMKSIEAVLQIHFEDEKYLLHSIKIKHRQNV